MSRMSALENMLEGLCYGVGGVRLGSRRAFEVDRRCGVGGSMLLMEKI
jgi:hypothetical protein